MSSNKSDVKINMLASKYRKYRNKKKQQSGSFWNGVNRVLEGCKHVWQMMPIRFRGWSSDFEQFDHYWQNEFGKQCALQQVSKLSVQNTLCNNKGQKIVLALLYSPSSFRTITAFLSNIPLDKIRDVLFCPLNIEGNTYQAIYEDKVGFYNQSILVLWQGLFDEQMMLGRVRLAEMSIWEDISRLSEDRAAYQRSIKKKALEEEGKNTYQYIS